jgi:hypothetical protein
VKTGCCFSEPPPAGEESFEMSYMLLIVEPQGQRRSRTKEQGRGLYERMLSYAGKLKAQGVLIATDSLREGAVRLELRDGKPRITDGPFTEAKELVGGFFLLDCASREQALTFAGECPAVEWATIEVREVGPCFE